MPGRHDIGPPGAPGDLPGLRGKGRCRDLVHTLVVGALGCGVEQGVGCCDTRP